LIAATFPDLYFKLGEYRPDLFWGALWLLILNILTGSVLRPRRLFAAGFICGLTFAVSIKTTFLLLIILVAGAVTWFLGRLLSGAITQGDGDNPGLRVVQGIFALVGEC